MPSALTDTAFRLFFGMCLRFEIRYSQFKLDQLVLIGPS